MQIENGKLSVCKATFGTEPNDCEVWEFILKNYSKLKFSPSVNVAIKEKAANPKRLQREAKKQTALCGIGTKSQQALQMQHEENKLMRKFVSKQQREEEKRRLFDLKQQKRKEKHKGR